LEEAAFIGRSPGGKLSPLTPDRFPADHCGGFSLAFRLADPHPDWHTTPLEFLGESMSCPGRRVFCASSRLIDRFDAAIRFAPSFVRSPPAKELSMSRPMSSRSRARKRSRVRSRAKKKDPIFVDGQRPRPMYVDYKDVELLKKMINRQGRIVGRRKSGCTAVSQHAVTAAVKRARYMALLPYVGD
jgi:small subunit ribosomal protein S18